MQTIRVLLVDDNPAFLDIAARELVADGRVQIVGRAQSGEDALAQVQRTQPDLVLLDIALPRMNGLKVTRQLKAQPVAPRVVLVTIHDTPDYRAAGVTAGADGFIAKEEFDTQILPLVEMLFGDLLRTPEQ